MSPAFSHRRMAWLLRARGTEIAAWPEADRHAAFDLLRRSPETRALFAEALAREDEEPVADGAVFGRMQQALRRSLAPLPMVLRGLGAGVLVACMAAGLYLAMTEPLDASGDMFNTVQTVSLAALDQ